MANSFWSLFLGFVTSLVLRSLAVPVVPPELASSLAILTPAARAVAQAELKKIGAFDSTIRVSKSGKLFSIDPKPTSIALSLDAISEGRHRRAISNQPPTGFTAEGVPIHHSLPGATRVIYLNFLGMNIADTAWNADVTLYKAKPYNKDGVAGLSAAEKNDISLIWRRVAEDFSPFRVDVTTERPATFTSKTGTILITESFDEDGVEMPAGSVAGGIAYLDVFGTPSYVSFFSPAIVYANNLGPYRESYIAECSSHEMGHNLGLSHDGDTQNEYYTGVGTGIASWAPIMGNSYTKHVTKFNNGDYPGANNQEDDLVIIAEKLPFRTDDHAATVAGSTAMTANNTGAYSTGIIEQTTDTDMFSFSTAPGPITITATPYTSTHDTYGNNLDIKIDLVSPAGVVMASANPSGTTTASLTFTILRAGPYYIRVSPSFDPVTPYTLYGSIGQYDVRTTRWYTIYQVTMATNPNFIIAGGSMWAWGVPSSSGDPGGNAVLGTVLTGTGLYTEPLVSDEVKSQPFSTLGFPKLRLSLDRWLGVSSGDTATIKVCIPSGACTTLWSGTATFDTVWKRIIYGLPAAYCNVPAVEIRFGLGPLVVQGTSSTAIGWNIRNLIISGQR